MPESAALGSTKAIVFDFDGVIIESTEIKTRAFLELFSAYPQHLEAIRRHHLDNLGISRFRKFEWIHSHLLGRELSPAESERLGREYSSLAVAKLLDCPLIPGAVELLRALQGRIPAWVASGTPQDELMEVVEKRGLRDYFEEVWGSPTPKEEILRRVLSSRRLEPEQLLMIGDGLSDYRAALATGVQFVARESPGSRQDWAEKPVRRVRDLTAVTPLLGLPASPHRS